MNLRRLRFHFFLLTSAFFLTVLPASAQVNLSGVWNNLGILHEDWPDRLFGPELGDYAGLPVTDAVRLRADTWDASLITLPEYQCRVHPSDYVPSFAGMRIWEERDMGFSTGTWDKDILTIKTTHLKEGWTRRNGLARSDKATVTEHFIRHGDHMTLVTIVTDPAYYTEPVVRSRDYEYEVAGDIGPYPCEPVEEVIRPQGEIPHHLPGTNPFLNEYAKAHGVPPEAARGGADTMYPEYRKKIRSGK